MPALAVWEEEVAGDGVQEGIVTGRVGGGGIVTALGFLRPVNGVESP